MPVWNLAGAKRNHPLEKGHWWRVTDTGVTYRVVKLGKCESRADRASQSQKNREGNPINGSNFRPIRVTLSTLNN